ncbi:MAG TPA: threonine/serine dehydratase [Povalibacter sp.]|uniref:threonine ammonia-lyase n=1 Tax=Povalibacter sp. TaxID=1962978 RepID=UPI002D1B16F3|nr:threonine/serine dehydratase [Povalibacter sp.]HMN45261.1 threonine/serine dehydratase [Povalibacter sp.]
MSTEPAAADVLEAARRIAGHATVTPVLRNRLLDERLGATVLVKAECLQVGGAFKFRGAYNRLSQLDAAERKHGVVAWSSGNHAQGVAGAAQRLGIRATIVMPTDAPAIKVDNTRAMGAEIVTYDRHAQDREQIGRDLARERGAVVVPPYDDPHIIAGQGTAALELAAQTRALVNRDLDLFLAPCGGGGLMAGSALALSAVSPQTKLYSVEPAACDDTARSLRSGKRESNPPGARTVCDSLMPNTPGAITFPINQQRLAGGLAVTDDQALDAIAFAWRELKVVVEPGGVVALAALLYGDLDIRGRTVGIILSGGNVDPALYREALSRPMR